MTLTSKTASKKSWIKQRFTTNTSSSLLLLFTYVNCILLSSRSFRKMRRRATKATKKRLGGNILFFHTFSNNNPWPFQRQSPLLCLFHPWTRFCMQKKSPRLFKCILFVVIESHSQMHLVIFHYFIAELQSPAWASFTCLFLLIIIILFAICECTHLASRSLRKIFH